MGSYFDIKDYEEPIHYYLDDIYFPLEYGRTTYKNIYIKRDNLFFDDDLLGFFDSTVEDHFY